ncbi:hypothetical protein HII36_44265 [Nonomuraea sp. NN258]|uniref:hypothetical protein n=1 Tax=Nonomuraea antri TaxID=2730852 RepID=UPI0015689A4B|nr:hypothetical protein [Nonomuraea antri]NRQ38792.1 hypothetical protein [Nonomuraea antri]
MAVYGLWFGGSGYSPSDDADLEEFTSIRHARSALIERYRYRYWQRSRFAYVHRDAAELLTPCVGEDCSILLYSSPGSLDCPERRLSLGPRGGVRSERC